MDLATTPVIRRWGLALLLGNVVVAAALCLATWYTLEAARKADLSQATDAADNIVHSVSVEVAGQLRLVDHALKSIANSAYPPGAPDGDPAPARLMEATQTQRDLMPFLVTIRYADASGLISSAYTAGPDRDIGDRDYFRRALATDAAVLSEPFICPGVRQWCVVLARRLTGPGGTARGVLYAALTSRQLAYSFAGLSLGRGGALSLRSSETLALVARYSTSDPGGGATTGLGTANVSAELKAGLQQSPEGGRFITRTVLDGIERASAYRRVPGYPLVLLAGLDTAQFVAPLGDEALRHWAFTGCVILLIALGSLYVWRQHVREAGALRYASQLARQQSIIIDTDWVGMIRVRERHIVWANRAALRILGHPREKLIGASSRILYPDEESYERIGREGYQRLREGHGYQTQVRVSTASGEAVWIDFSGAALADGESVWMFVNIDTIKHSEQRAYEIALHDPLTGLANRRLLDEQLRQAVAQAGRKGGEVAVCFVDLDGFKPINDHHGHDAGDEVLRTVAVRLLHELRDHDLVARIGGDEFVVVLVGLENKAQAALVLQRCMATVARPMALEDGQWVTVGCSMGVAFGSDCAWSADALVTSADAAMYEGKHAGKGRIVYAAPQMEGA